MDEVLPPLSPCSAKPIMHHYTDMSGPTAASARTPSRNITEHKGFYEGNTAVFVNSRPVHYALIYNSQRTLAPHMLL